MFYYCWGEMSIFVFKMKVGGDLEIDGWVILFKFMGKAVQFFIDFFFYDLEDVLLDNLDLKFLVCWFIIEVFNIFDYGKCICVFRFNNI